VAANHGAVEVREEGGVSTEISWCDETWNPTTGCSKVSEGCRNCYAAKLAPRLAAMGQEGYTTLPWTKKNAPENVMLHSGRLDKPYRWKKPRRIFVNSMSDLFHPLVPFEFVERVWDTMFDCSQHTFQILTKRPERMAEFARWMNDVRLRRIDYPNVWLGTSVEDQRAADQRILHLLRTPAAVRFLSCEPLIGPVDIYKAIAPTMECGCNKDTCAWSLCIPLGWIIVGGESGPGYRQMDPAWARQIRDFCRASGVAFFYKQDSGFRNEMNPYLDGEMWRQFPQTTAVSR
jgi:protein gp37